METETDDNQEIIMKSYDLMQNSVSRTTNSIGVKGNTMVSEDPTEEDKVTPYQSIPAK